MGDYAKRIFPGGILVCLLCGVFAITSFVSQYSLSDILEIGFPIIIIIMLALLLYGFISQITLVFYAEIIGALRMRSSINTGENEEASLNTVEKIME